MMKQEVVCILLLAFLSFVGNPHTAFAEGISGGHGDFDRKPEGFSSETLVIGTVVTVVVIAGITYLYIKHKEKSQEKEKEEALEQKEEARKRQRPFIHGGEMALIRW